MKKIISLLLVIAVIFGMCSCEPSAKYPKEVTTLEEFKEAIRYFENTPSYAVQYSLDYGYDVSRNDMEEPMTDEDIEQAFALINSFGSVTWVEEGILRLDLYFLGAIHSFQCTPNKLDKAKELALKNPCMIMDFD